MDAHERQAAAVRLEGLSKRWAGAAALDGVSLDVAAGSFCVLLGPSGCGKTTLLRILAGLETADAGRVWIGGRDVTALPPAARGLAMVFQSYALFPHLTVAENIVFGLRARSVPAAERVRRLRDAAALLGLEALLSRKPGQLSGGQQQRVALGRAVVAQAPVCLMDEPLSNLDAQLRAEMRREIHALQRRLGITMVYVTHDQTEAMAMADQVVLLRAGRIEADGPPASIYDRPPTGFAAAFIGTPPMNLLPLERRGGAAVVAGTELAIPGAEGAALFGVRPEALRLLDPGAAWALPGVVRAAEYLGADTILEVAVGAATVLARLPGAARVIEGQRVGLGFAPADVHLFAPEGGRMEARPVPEEVGA
jgi:sn-glycerol 3-phosphate transport system ATP-binding protein